jgi:hypothetical protein
LSDSNSNGNSCQTKKGPGRPRLYQPGTSERITFRLRRGVHDEILEVLDALPGGATSAWIVNALRCYVTGQIRDVEQETRAIEEELAGDLFGMFQEDDDEQ